MYPVRVGEHSNTAFGLIFAMEYAECKFSIIFDPKTTLDYIFDQYIQIETIDFLKISYQG